MPANANDAASHVGHHPDRDVNNLPPAKRWLTPYEVADYTQHHYQTVLHAMRSGELRATQRCKRGSWRAEIADVDAWLRGERPLARVTRLAVRRGVSVAASSEDMT